mmetsp:Transcript_4971/g.13232  ORF Transcript_4971/g.13232 Transcript_4971/m.13232 type:complete len:309 (-) Transcript_4971:752-1678(-)
MARCIKSYRHWTCRVLTIVLFAATVIHILSTRTATPTPHTRSSTFGIGTNPRLVTEHHNLNTHALEVDGFRHHLSTFTNSELRQISSPWTMVSEEHFETALEAVKKVNENGIPGDVVECGVWKGGMSMSMAMMNLRSNTERRFWLFDTFDGLPEPTSEYDDENAKQHFKDLKEGKNTSKILRSTAARGMEEGKWNYGPIDVVKNNMRYTTYPAEKINFVKGKVEETLKKVALPEKIAILRLDTDWYDSTKAELDVFWDRLQSGGILLVDDYCMWKGATTAVDQFFADKLGLRAAEISKKSPCLHYWKP